VKFEIFFFQKKSCLSSPNQRGRMNGIFFMEGISNRIIRKLTAGILLVIGLSVLMSCRSETVQQNGPPAKRVITDDLGRKVALPAEVKRAVSLAPNLTEIIFAVDAGERLVGVTTFCNYPEEAKNIRKVGDTLKPNIENIIALKPDVVFVTTASQLEAFTATLEKQNINVFVTNPNSLADIYRSIEKIGGVFGKTQQAEKLVGNLKERVKKIEDKTKDAEKIKTFVQIDKSLYTIGRDSYITDLIEKAGGVSVTKDVPTAYPKISREKALALDPQAIILSESPDNDEPNEAFANSEAVKNKRVFRINSDILSRPAPRIIEALEQIAGALHPEKFE